MGARCFRGLLGVVCAGSLILAVSGCAEWWPKREADPDLVELLVSIAAAELESGPVRGVIAVAEMHDAPEWLEEALPGFGGAPAEIAFTVRDRHDFEFTVTLPGATPLRYRSDMASAELAGEPLATISEIFDKETNSPREDAALALYVTVMSHLFPLTSTPATDVRVFRHILESTGLSPCGSEDGNICAESLIAGEIVWRYHVAPGDPPHVLRYQTLLEGEVIDDNVYASPVYIEANGKKRVFMEEYMQGHVEQVNYRTVLRSIEPLAE